MSDFTPEAYRTRAAEDDLYAGLLLGDSARASTKTLLDLDYASLYAENLLGHLSHLSVPASGSIIDLGCGAGAVTAGLHRILDRSALGIDLSPSAIAYAQKAFPGPSFVNRSADELDDVPPASVALVHAREFYPFTRTADADLHMRFPAAAHPKLVSGGLFVAVQIRDPSVGVGLHMTLPEVQRRAREIGYRACGVRVMIPQFLFRRFGRVTHLAPVEWAAGWAGRALEAVRPGRVSFLYWFRA